MIGRGRHEEARLAALVCMVGACSSSGRRRRGEGRNRNVDESLGDRATCKQGGQEEATRRGRHHVCYIEGWKDEARRRKACDVAWAEQHQRHGLTMS